MTSGHYGSVLRHINRLFNVGTVTGLSEGQLLERFVARRDEAAFEALVARHGPMVLGVCRQVLRDSHEAEDAFQATFLVLVRKAGSLRQRHLLGNWLYGVAYRVAMRARANSARRRERERPGAEEAAVEPAYQMAQDDVGPVLHEEVNRLPGKYRAPVVLCYLEGHTHEEAAAQLRWPVGTVKGRLSRALDQLRSKLTRRGLALSAGLLTTELARSASAAVPTALVDSTVQAAVLVAASPVAAAGSISASAAALSEGVLKAMIFTKIKVGAAVVLAAGVVVTGAGVLAQQGGGARPGKPAQTAEANAVVSEQADQNSVAALAEARLEAARKTYEHALADFKAERIRLDPVYLWSCRWLESQTASSPDQGGRITALEAHLNRMKTLEGFERTATGNGSERGLDLPATEYYCREAELWLADAKAVMKTDQGGVSSGGIVGMHPGNSGGGMAGSGGLKAGSLGSAGVLAGPALGGFGGGVGAVNPFMTLEASRADPKNKAILDKLEQPIPMRFVEETPLEDVLKYIKTATQGPDKKAIPIYVDPVGLREAGMTIESPVIMDVEGVALKTTLKLLLKQVSLGYCVKDGLLTISADDSELLMQYEEPVRVRHDGLQ